jgi:hypothetical protein
MTPSWNHLCKGARIEVEDGAAVLTFEGGRKHRVAIAETESTYELKAIVARNAQVRDLGDNLILRLWRRNRSAQLTGFRCDTRGTVCATGWVPRVGLTAEEFQLVLHRVASEADRLEYLLTGTDAE